MVDGVSDVADRAIRAALEQCWEDAVKLNNELLDSDKENIDALNRLGFAYLKLGKVTLAKRTFQQVKDLDQYNQIAEKNLKKLETLRAKDVTRDPDTKLSPMQFLEEPGKTKVVSCVKLAPVQVLSTVTSGQEVYLKARNHCVEIRDSKKRYLGALPDDLSYKLLKLLSAGNTYMVVIKGISKNELSIFIRETGRGKRFALQPTFAPTVTFIPYSREDMADPDKPNVTPTGEEEEDVPPPVHEEAV